MIVIPDVAIVCLKRELHALRKRYRLLSKKQDNGLHHIFRHGVYLGNVWVNREGELSFWRSTSDKQCVGVSLCDPACFQLIAREIDSHD